MTAKKFNIVDFLINNGIIMVLIILAIVTGILQPTFFSTGNIRKVKPLCDTSQQKAGCQHDCDA